MKIAFLVLAHDQPAQCSRLADRLLAQGADVFIHADERAGSAFIERFNAHLQANKTQVTWAPRTTVEWGKWSMVRATLNGLQAIADSGSRPDYVYLISGADYPVRPLDELRAFLREHHGREFIESVNALENRWVTDGLQEERWRYRHWVSWRTHPWLFDKQWRLQRLLGLRREMPAGLKPHMGSQWWTLTWPTCEAILELARDTAIESFFRTTWVPDELFFQTAVRKVVDRQENIDSRHLTLYRFDVTGQPLVFHDDHAELLASQPYFFARKLSTRANQLRDHLDAAPGPDFQHVAGHYRTVALPLEEYDAHIEQRASGLPGVRRMLRPDPGNYGDLAWNRRPYVVVIGECANSLRATREHLDNIDGLVCHGELMAPGPLDLADTDTGRAGYQPGDSGLRDHSPVDFLADLINDAPDSHVAWLLRPGQVSIERHKHGKPTRTDLALMHAEDPNARLVFPDTDGTSTRDILQAARSHATPHIVLDLSAVGEISPEQALSRFINDHLPGCHTPESPR
ncbi:beta-1,6-N-acetylglucosaminyltransferase [Marinihelvus fidelis]|uniref:Peptide O-xylosyltransferase n=1 Tax=Marinihelvus fidelis TaxID=2613842 RepID=A0A5N0TEF0_9GAMM|nr:beta-1,6-N-acetylglucosaminyltransferase [Marinihelvus fidelis]KAA9133360.1 beta-1,6-N-acetylglucosaminyltransferase [Marinihelvus fidelis]